MNNTELIDQFTSEARDLLESIDQRLMDIEQDPSDTSRLNDLFRLVHTLKGNCGLFEFTALETVVHAAEDLLDKVRDHTIPYSGDIADRILAAMDYAGQLLEEIAAHGTLPSDAQDTSSQHVRALRAMLPQPDRQEVTVLAEEPPQPERPAWVDEHRVTHGAALSAVCYQPEPECFYKGEDPWRLACQAPGLLWLEVDVLEDAEGAEDCYRCGLRLRLLSSAPAAYLRDHFRFVPEQISVWDLQAGETSTSADAEAPSALGSGARELYERRWTSLWRDQCALLTRPDLRPGTLVAIRHTLLALTEGAAAWDLPYGCGAAQAGDLPATREALLTWANEQGPALPPAGTKAPPPAVAGEVSAVAHVPTGEESGNRVIKVSQDKIDRLMDLIGEMVVAKNALPYLAAKAEAAQDSRDLAREIKAQYSVINRIAEDMQYAIMQVRMLPVGTVFQRFGRLVRDISRKLGKDVRLELSGEDTEADKNVIEALAEPLVHILRNSLDHGIELPSRRVENGKAAQGVIRVSARQDGDRVVIDIHDDGAGIDPAFIRAKAVSKGLMTEERAAALSDQDAQSIIFLPGFSTAESVTDLSGRGVGMDVVRSAVERINGSLTLESTLGLGTRIQLALPLSMAVTNVMIIETAGKRFGIPMDLIVETVRVNREDISQFKQAQTAVLRGRIVPLRSMNEMLAMDEPQKLNAEQEHAVLVVRMGNENAGLVVDDFHGTCDIILKPMEGVLTGLTGFAGTALMGDGSVLLILNPKELLS